MRNDKQPLVDSLRSDLRTIYQDTLWLTSNLNIAVSLLHQRGVVFDEREQGFFDHVWKTIEAMQAHIESRARKEDLV